MWKMGSIGLARGAPPWEAAALRIYDNRKSEGEMTSMRYVLGVFVMRGTTKTKYRIWLVKLKKMERDAVLTSPGYNVARGGLPVHGIFELLQQLRLSRHHLASVDHAKLLLLSCCLGCGLLAPAEQPR